MGLMDFFKKKNASTLQPENCDKFEIVNVFQDDKLLLKLIGVKMATDVTFENNEKTDIIAFETSIGIDFVKVIASRTRLGIGSERAYASGVYPGFEKETQSLLEIKINGVTLPCDLIHYKNNETGEEKDIYYEISSFFGK
jgi:hypothetical protein